ncbi:MAG: hypothetical protein GTN76_14270 [Candidatus Aenigmarchaeota archaeon]|nr:hypothetical protein [Candidatus Aenigmarchaeota archaeon]
MRGVLVGFIVFLVLINSASALVELDPASEDLSIFSDMYKPFVVNVTISGANNVYAFQFDLSYDPNIFEIESASNISNGTFLNRNGQDSDYCINANVSTPGLIDNFICSRTGSGSVSGSGVLANVKFKLKSLTTFPSTSDLILSNVKISDINSQPLDNSSQNGNATVYECLSGETKGCVGGTRTCGSNNQWGGCIASPDGNGNGGPSNGGPPSGPSNGGNGEDGDGNGEEPSSGDVNGDGCVNTLDLAIIGVNFNLSSGFDERADLDNDGKVDVMDLALVALDFGSGCNG